MRLLLVHIFLLISLLPMANSETKTLKMMTYNMAHGRGESSNPVGQFFLSADDIKSNLDKIAAIIVEEKIDIVAFQEIDQNAAWSGGFDHLKYLAEKTGHQYFVFGLNNWGNSLCPLEYGNAFLSKYPITYSQNFPFENWFSFGGKGFLYAEVEVEGDMLPLVTTHLDYKFSHNRLQQIEKVIGTLENIRKERFIPQQKKFHPFIMGDFNISLDQEADAVSYLLNSYDFFTFENLVPKDEVTYPKVLLGLWGPYTLDYIFVPLSWNILSYQVPSYEYSDHYPVIVELQKRF